MQIMAYFEFVLNAYKWQPSEDKDSDAMPWDLALVGSASDKPWAVKSRLSSMEGGLMRRATALRRSHSLMWLSYPNKSVSLPICRVGKE